MRSFVRIAICDLGLGNLPSVERALRRAAGADVAIEITADPDVVAKAEKVVVPGQGAFRDCTRALDRGLGKAIAESIGRGVPYLGICLGMQVLFGDSEEAPGCRGLGVFAGSVRRLAAAGPEIKIPHVGWNTADTSGRSPLLLANEHFYFVHSYVVVPDDPSIIAATTEHGVPFVSAIAKGNVFACQFHPEKSQAAGLALLTRFASV